MEELDDLKQYLLEVENLSDDEDIIEIKNDLNELIKLKSEELLESKRYELLNRCNNIDLTMEPEQVYTEERSVGSTVSVLFHYNNGSYGPRNAVVVGKHWEADGIRYRICYIHPMYTAEEPCDSTIVGSDCKELSCVYNHGVEVAAKKLCNTIDVDVNEGDVCLAQVKLGGLWARAKVMHICREQDSVVVELIDRAGSRLDHTHAVTMRQVVRHSDSFLCSTMQNDEGCSNDDVDCISTFTESTVQPNTFGHWEAHTRGVGLALLIKMGYRMGDGLGARNQGRVSPVQVVAPNHKRKNVRKIRATKMPAIVAHEDHDSINGIKTAIVRNHDKISAIRDNIDQLEKVKKRNSCDKTMMQSANERIHKLQSRVSELEKNERSLLKKQSKKQCSKKKLNIF